MQMTRAASGLVQRLLIGGLMFAPWLIALHAGAADDAAAILGEWHGTSVCTDLVLAPACKNEVVVYEVSRPSGIENGKLLIKADKVIDGKRVPMGELEIGYSAADKTWSGEFRNERVHIQWSYQVSGDTLTGTLIQYPSKGVVRRASANRKG